ncbi:MAG: hypothetical protein GF401_12505 [Chitinivibrionales bacterium]|nr:hypothetical protein [Chitinivibrionales bacterium]
MKRNIPVLSGAIIALVFLVGCGDDDDNGVSAQEPGSVSLTPNFIGTVTDTTPIVIEVKESKLGDPVVDTMVTLNNTEVLIGDIPPDQYVVALWWDEDGDGQLDETEEPLVFYSIGEIDQSVGILGDATEIAIQSGDVEALGEIAFSD